MTILHTESSTGWGGQEVRILLEARAMQERGHRVLLACAPDCRLAQRAREWNLPVEGIVFQRSIDGRAILRLRRLMRKERVDVLNTHSSKDSWCGGIAARLARGVKVVRTRHVSIPIKNNLPTRWLYTRLTDAIITTGEKLREQLIRDNGFRAERIVSIATGVDLQRFNPSQYSRQTVREEWGLAPDAPLVGTIAMLRRMKGHNVLIEAAAQVLQQMPQAKFLIVGDIPSASPLKQQLEEQVARLGIGGSVIFAGYREDVPEILAALDCVVLPSTRDEGVPQSVAQALAMARPVVATDVGATAELIEDGVTGILVPPGDAAALATGILSTLREPEQASQRALVGQQRVRERYSVERMAEQVERLYERLVIGPLTH